MAALLRFSFEAHRGGVVALDQEMKIVRDYLEIEQARLGNRLRYSLETSGTLDELRVPPLSVQTLVETASSLPWLRIAKEGRSASMLHEAMGCSASMCPIPGRDSI